eukprot:15466337-Alexandrium_andersonii.AAC.1
MSFRDNGPGFVGGVDVRAVHVWSSVLCADAGRLMLVCRATSRASRSRVSRFRAQNMREARTGRDSVPENPGSEAHE